MTRSDGTPDQTSSQALDCNSATGWRFCDEPIEDDEPASASDIEECVRRLDEVWPPEESTPAERPRKLGRFTILGELGHGGFGVVFLAEDPMTGRRVALKVPRIEILSGDDGWRRFVRESRASSRLDHPNLVPSLEAGVIGPLGYIVSTYVAGPSLEQWLRHSRAKAPPRWGARLVATLAHAIEHAHQRQILHRDLKPANVLLQAPDKHGEMLDHAAWEKVPLESWLPRICDFGLAKLREIEGDESHSGGAAGSPSYMAPEQAESRRADIGPATDVYGLGAILYQILTGRPPFAGKNDLDTLSKVVNDEPAAPRQLRPGIARDLETICLKCLAKRPEQRYPEAAALAEDLERFLDGRPILARPVAVWERGWRWARRRPTVAALVAALVLAACAGVAGLLWHDSRLGQVNEQLRLKAIQADESAHEANNQKGRAEAHAYLVRRQFGGHQVFSAQQATLAKNFEVARRLLDAAGPQLETSGDRGFAWSFLNRFVRDRFQLLEGHVVAVWALAVAPDRHTLASGDEGGEIRLWDLTSGNSRKLAGRGGKRLQHLLFSPDGRSLVSSTFTNGECLLWDVPTGRLRGKLEQTGSDGVSSLLFTRNGRSVAAVRRGLGQLGLPLVGFDITGVAGEMPFVGSNDAKAIADELTDQRLQDLADRLDDDTPNRLESLVAWKRSWVERPPRGVAGTRDKKLAVVGFGDGSFAAYGVAWNRRFALGRINTQGTAIVVFDSPTINENYFRGERARLKRLPDALVPAMSRRLETDIVVHKGAFDPAAFSADGRRLAIWNEKASRLEVLELATGRGEFAFDLVPLRDLHSMTFTPDGEALVFGELHGKIRVWHLNSPHSPQTFRGHAPKEAWSVAFSPDGRTLASAGDDQLIRLWDVASGRETAVLRGHGAMVSSIAFSADGRMLASGSFERKTSVILWDLATGRRKFTLCGHTAYVREVAFHPDSQSVASVGDDGKLMLWGSNTGKPTVVISEHANKAACVAFSPNGTIVASGDLDGRIILHDLATWKARTIEAGAEVHGLAYSPDGTHLTAGLFGGSIKTWDVASDRPPQSLSGHTMNVEAVAVSPDGRSLASGSMDGTVRVWDARTGQELLCLTDCKARVNSVAFSPDGSILAAADHSGAVTLWRSRASR